MTSIARKPTSQPLPDLAREAILASPGFGRFFTDHMVTIEWTEGRGWHDAQLVPYGPLELDPATMSLHYGQEIFEGLKAYRRADGSIATFRPEMNARRFQRSARRLAMPELPEELFLGAIGALVDQDQGWVPGYEETSLYLRPFMFATEVGLGVKPASSYLFMLIASPAGAYFHGGIKPVSVWLSTEYVRAAPGGTGEAKCAGNYAASLIAQAQAAAEGCDQVVGRDAAEHRWVEEMGGMNLYFVFGSGDTARLVTPELTGALLPGVTRSSILQVAEDLGIDAEEGRISIDDWREGNADGTITEVFACGTAAVVTPVGKVRWSRGEWMVGDGQPGPITERLREHLLNIQHGRADDAHDWMHELVSS
ncbi:MAG: branched-chain amino acid aminotransferase [Actinomycetia bacterium]|nr:branched-chain amino acid aminotransferase [Actinomycetes bacterium]